MKTKLADLAKMTPAERTATLEALVAETRRLGREAHARGAAFLEGLPTGTAVELNDRTGWSPEARFEIRR